MHSELSYGLSFAPKLQRVATIDLSGSHQPTPDPSFSRTCAIVARHFLFDTATPPTRAGGLSEGPPSAP